MLIRRPRAVDDGDDAWLSRSPSTSVTECDLRNGSLPAFGGNSSVVDTVLFKTSSGCCCVSKDSCCCCCFFAFCFGLPFVFFVFLVGFPGNGFESPSTDATGVCPDCLFNTSLASLSVCSSSPSSSSSSSSPWCDWSAVFPADSWADVSSFPPSPWACLQSSLDVCSPLDPSASAGLKKMASTPAGTAAVWTGAGSSVLTGDEVPSGSLSFISVLKMNWRVAGHTRTRVDLIR